MEQVAIGNPTSYYNGTRWTMEWGAGKKLNSATAGSTEVEFTYDADGQRLTKTVGNVTHTYYYAGGKLLRETFGSNTLDFFYNADGSPYAFKYNGTPYYYVTNLQGDVMRIVDSDAVCVGVYRYDPYGNLVSSSGDLVSVNPLRYRSYYYDSETGFYYLQSRYYDPEIGRFINADDFASTGQGILGHNMFAYCMNNPINGFDPMGYWGRNEQAIVGTTMILIGLALLLAPPTGGASLGALVLSSSAIATYGAATAFAGTVIVGDAINQANIDYAKKSRQSDKERSTKHPSWVSQSDVDLRKSAQQNAMELLNKKYGAGNWRKGPGSDFNQIVKWINRSLKVATLIVLEMAMEK